MSLQRGVSLLAALVFVGILTVAAIGFQQFSTHNNPQALTAQAAAPTTNSGKQPEGSSQEQCKPGYVYKISATSKDLKVSARDEVAQCWEWTGLVVVRTGWTCGAKYGCYRALSNAPQQCRKDGGAKPDKCRIYTCLSKEMLKDKNGNECALLGDFDPDRADTILGCEKLDRDCIKAMKEDKITSKPLEDLLKTVDPKKVDTVALPAAQQDAISKAFQEEQAAQNAKILAQEDAGNTAEKQINAYAKKNCANVADNDCLAEIDPSLAAKAGLECRNANSTVQDGQCYVPAGDALRQIQSNKDLADQVKLQASKLSPDKRNPDLGECPGKPGCPGNPTTFGPGNGPGNGPGGGGLGDILGKMAPFLGSLARALLAPQPPQPPSQACPSDPNQYAQYQQQYQQQLQQYNYQLQQYNYQQQLNSYYGGGYGGYGSIPPPVQPTPCTPSIAQQCQAQPTQPPAQNCNAGAWKPTQSGACITGWQCVPNSANAPIVSLSCEPKVADVGMTLAISYSCSAGTALGSGFTASTSPSGSATTTIATPPAGTNLATYRLTCNNSGVTAGAQCSVQVSRVSIILVANPKSVPSGATSLLGWITSGMQSCVVSSPDDASFTARNSSNTSVAGTATTSPITATTSYLLHCQTIGGGVRDATTTVSVQ